VAVGSTVDAAVGSGSVCAADAPPRVASTERIIAVNMVWLLLVK
jgi:hypothetical protein